MRGAGGARRPVDCCVELEITPGKANRARVNRSPVPRAREMLGILRTRAVRARGPGAGQGRPGRAAPVPRRPAGRCAPRGYAGVRADYDRVLKQRNALLQVGRRRPSAPAGATCAPSTSGTRTWPPPAPSCWPAGSTWSTRCGRWSTRPTRRWPSRRSPRPGRRRSTTGRSLGEDVPLVADRDMLAAAMLDADRRGRARPSWSAASPWSARTATSWCSSSGRCRPRATPATASPGRSRWRCGWRPTTCSGPRPTPAASRCWCSTTCSPSSTPAGASGWPSWWPGPSRCWSPPRCPEDVPEALSGARVDVMGGEVRRIR